MSPHPSSGTPIERVAIGLARLRRAARGVAFWIAIALPLLYVPAIVTPDLVAAKPWTVAALLGGNALALLLGHGHDPGRPGT